MNREENPYYNKICPITGNAIATNLSWDIVLSDYKVFFGVINRQIILVSAFGNSTAHTSNVYEKHLQRVVSEEIEPEKPYVSCDNYANFERSTARARSIFIHNMTKKHPRLKGIYFYNTTLFFNYIIRFAKRFLKPHFDFNIVHSYKEALKNAYEILGIDFSKYDNIEHSNYLTCDDWSFSCGESTTKFRVYNKDIITVSLSAGFTYPQLIEYAEKYQKVLDYVRITSGISSGFNIVDISNLSRDSIRRIVFGIRQIKKIKKRSKKQYTVIVGSNFLSRMVGTFINANLPDKVYFAKTFLEAMNIITKLKKGKIAYKSHKFLPDESEKFLKFLGTISWDVSGELPDSIGQNEELSPIYEVVRMIKSDVDEVLRQRDEKEIELEKLSAELKRHNELLESKVEERTMALNMAKEAAEAANRTKSDFLAKISHELRTPMHGILSFSRFGIKKANRVSTDKLIHYFENINESGNRLMALVNNLLDLSKLECGKMPFVLRKHDIKLNLEAIRSQLSPLLEEKNLELIIEDFDLPLFEYDRDRIMQVFTNLIGNAIKFSAQNDVIEISFEIIKKNNVEYVQVCIMDRGIGIPANELEEIFCSFKQSSNTVSSAGGTGLGLSIAREIIVSHNGNIFAQNREGGGTIFFVELPLGNRDE